MGWQVPHLMAELNYTPSFYSITRIYLDISFRGRVSLAGNVGYCRGPAAGGGTSWLWSAHELLMGTSST
jgi:hypothetical protein